MGEVRKPILWSFPLTVNPASLSLRKAGNAGCAFDGPGSEHDDYIGDLGVGINVFEPLIT